MAASVIRERGPWDHVIHLGDSLLDAVALAAEHGVDVVGLRGNDEFPGCPDLRDELIFESGGVKFYAVHGHELGLENSDSEEKRDEKLGELARLANEAGAAVALFGHTREPLILHLAGILIVNPGSLGKVATRKTYAEIKVNDKGGVEATIQKA